MGIQITVRHGYIIAITGCMKSGKSSFADAIINKERHSNKIMILIFTPIIGRRKITVTNTETKIDQVNMLVTRNGSTHDAIEFPENEPEFILEYVRRVRAEHPDMLITVIIEEAHFCSPKLLQVVKDLAELYDCKTIVVGLDQKSTEEGFGPMPEILKEADVVHKLQAVCEICGDLHATKSYLRPELQKKLDQGNILVGDDFTVLCRHCNRAQKEKDAALSAQQP
ncbi:MAG: hypothetical protein V1928_01490 [Parcubacteria group bacterium]